MIKIRVFAIFTLLLLLVGCSSKSESIDDEEFKSIMKNEGFEVYDVLNQFEGIDFIEEAYVALNSENKYQIEFYELDDEEDAVLFYNNNKRIFEESKTGKSIVKYVDLINTNKYSLTTDDSYKYISRIDDTVVYLNVSQVYKNEVTNILKKLGY